MKNLSGVDLFQVYNDPSNVLAILQDIKNISGIVISCYLHQGVWAQTKSLHARTTSKILKQVLAFQKSLSRNTENLDCEKSTLEKIVPQGLIRNTVVWVHTNFF